MWLKSSVVVLLSLPMVYAADHFPFLGQFFQITKNNGYKTAIERCNNMCRAQGFDDQPASLLSKLAAGQEPGRYKSIPFTIETFPGEDGVIFASNGREARFSIVANQPNTFIFTFKTYAGEKATVILTLKYDIGRDTFAIE
jgi:hypothetical protein